MKFIAHATENTENFAKMTTAEVGKISAVPNTDTLIRAQLINMRDYDGTYATLIENLLEEGSKLDVALHDEHITHIKIRGEGDKPFIIERMVTSSNNVIITGFNHNNNNAFFGYKGTRGKISQLNNLSIAETFPFETWEHYSTSGPVSLDCGEYIRNGIKGIVFTGHIDDLVDNQGNIYIRPRYTLDIKRSMLPWETEGSYIIRSKEFNPQGYRLYLREAMISFATNDGNVTKSRWQVLDDYLVSPDKNEAFKRFLGVAEEAMGLLHEVL